MKREAQLAAELRALRALCDKTMPVPLSQNLIKSLEGHVFLGSDDHVVFESIRALLQGGPISAERLVVHLNNRGFPDIDMARYFATENVNSTPPEGVNKKSA